MVLVGNTNSATETDNMTVVMTITTLILQLSLSINGMLAAIRTIISASIFKTIKYHINNKVPLLP